MAAIGFKLLAVHKRGWRTLFGFQYFVNGNKMRVVCIYLLAIVGSALLSLSPARASNSDECREKYGQMYKSVPDMTFKQFDQSEFGWRSLGNCFEEQGKLISWYVSRHERQTRALNWHLAQVLAMSGDTDGAIKAALASINPADVESRSSFSWNTYAMATIAYFRRDRKSFDEQLLAHRLAVERSADNQRNLEVLLRLSKCFDKDYSVAYTCDLTQAE